MDAKDIKNFAEELKDYFHTNDPFALAEIFGIKVIINRMMSRDRKAYTIKTGDYPTCIIINGRYSGNSQIVLCAHELGHALLHNDGINSFAVTKENVFTNIEYEANLFAVSLLFEESDFNVHTLNMNNYLLRTILDFNIED